MVDSKKAAIEFIRSQGIQNVQRIAKFAEQPYRAMANTLLEIAGEEVST
jgi:hypothetical protein